MRSPSAEQKEGDLDRLTTSASIRSNVSSNSAQTVIKSNVNNNDDNNNSSSNYLPNIIIASAEYQQCRKRKDRQDSSSSLNQDRKLVRSNSEEHVSCGDKNNDVIRRVSSHEDFKKPLPLHEHNENDDDVELDDVKVNTKESNENDSSSTLKHKIIDANSSHHIHHHLSTHSDFNDENEQRRHSERFLKTKSPSGRKSPRKPSRKSSPTPYWEDYVRENNVNKINDDDSSEKDDDKPSRSLYPWENYDEPVVCQRFAENTFDHVHHSIAKFIKHDHDLVKYCLINDDNTPVISEKKQFSNFMGTESMKIRDVMQNSHSPVGSYQYQTPDERIRQINKRLSSLKRKIAAYEENFETSYGYRPSQADKTNDKHIKNYIAEIHKLRKEKSQIKADPMTAMGYKNKFENGETRLMKVKDTILEIEKRLREKRDEDNRSPAIDELSSEQLIQEKSSVQRALLYFESIFGRPATADERDAARPLYDRYRLLKRLVSRHNSICGVGFELPTILENEALALSGLVSPNDSSPPCGNSQVQSPSDSSTSTSIDTMPALNTNAINENWNVNSMNVQELYAHYNVIREEKKQLRRTIKEFEHNFEEVNGRKMLKGDRNSIEDTYASYKQKKAKLRLLDALVRKQMAN